MANNNQDLDGRTFVAREIPGFPGGEVELKFADGMVSGYTGCNRFGGPYQIENGHLSTPMPFRTTLMACIGVAAELEPWVQKLLQSSPTVSLVDGTLTVGDLKLSEAIPSP